MIDVVIAEVQPKGGIGGPEHGVIDLVIAAAADIERAGRDDLKFAGGVVGEGIEKIGESGVGRI